LKFPPARTREKSLKTAATKWERTKHITKTAAEAEAAAAKQTSFNIKLALQACVLAYLSSSFLPQCQ
jgi:hypothetical protein